MRALKTNDLERMEEYNPETVVDALKDLDHCLSKSDKTFLLEKIGEDIDYLEYMRINIIAASIASKWLNKGSKLPKSIPNYEEFERLNYGHAILKIYKRYLSGQNLNAKNILLRVNWMECPKSILDENESSD